MGAAGVGARAGTPATVAMSGDDLAKGEGDSVGEAGGGSVVDNGCSSSAIGLYLDRFVDDDDDLTLAEGCVATNLVDYGGS